MLLTLLLLFTVTVQLIVSRFPDHDWKESIVMNQGLDPRDPPACGLFRQQNDDGRVYLGTKVYDNQFPWTVCLIQPVGEYATRYADGRIETQRGTIKKTIYDFGPDSQNSRMSTIKEEIWRTQITSWQGFCVGTIVNPNWILTAAHCLHKQFEGFVITINAGVNQCHTKRHKNIREVIVQRQESLTRTIFEHENYIALKGKFDGRQNFDIALIRLLEPLDIPTDNYNNEPINSICLFSVDRFIPKSGCLDNIYYSGFGQKTDKDSKNNLLIYDPDGSKTGNSDPGQELTYLKQFRTSMSLCTLAFGQEAMARLHSVYCYSSVLKDFETDLKKNGSITKKEFAGRNETEIRNTPNLCPGDSGGPWMYYLRSNGTGRNNEIMFRAVQVSTVYGIRSWGDLESYCEGLFSRGKDKLWKRLLPSFRGWYKSLAMGPMLYKYIDWFNNIMFVRNYTGRPSKIALIHNDVHFPELSQITPDQSDESDD